MSSERSNMWGLFWWILEMILFVLAPFANPIASAFRPCPPCRTISTLDTGPQNETLSQALLTLILHARMPYVLVVGKMRRAFEEARDVASLPSTLEIVFRTCYIRHFDEELNPEGLEHCGSDFQVKWDKCIEDIGWWYSVSGPCTLLAGIIALFVGHDYLTGNIPKDASPALLWCGRLAASSATWAAVYLAIFNSCSGTLRGAHVGALWAVYADGVRETDFWWNWPFALALPGIYVCWSIVIRLVLQLVLICQQGNIESPSTISGRFFKACVVLYNLQALAHLVGTIGFWKMFYLLPDYWKWRLAPLRREEGLRKIQEREKILQQRELDAAAIPVGPIVNMLQYTAGPVPVDERNPPT